MRYIIGILLIAILIEPSVFACSPNFDARYEEPIEIVKGINGDCYYKLTPPIVKRYFDTQGQTEFYLKEDDIEPTFIQQNRLYDDILCTKDIDGNGAIAYVHRRGAFSTSRSRSPYPDWLSFFVNGELVKSYSPIDIIERENNLDDSYWCVRVYLQDERGFVKDGKSMVYVYQLITIDGSVISFDPLTGEKLSTVKPLHTLLVDGVRNNDLEQVKDILQKGANPDKGNKPEGTPLHLAAELGHVKITKELLKAGAKLDFRHTKKCSSYCDWGNCEGKECVSWETGNSTEDSIPHHPLYMAVLNKHFGVVEVLVAHGVDVNAGGYVPHYPNSHSLEIAIQELNFEAIDLLISLGADVKQAKSLCALVKTQGNEEMIIQMAKLLLESGADINTSLCREITPLIITIAYQNGSLASFFIKNGADVNFIDRRGASVLYYAIRNKDVVTLLLKNGANPNAIPTVINEEDKYIKPPPLFAARNEIKQLLLNYGADVNITSIVTGNNALQHELFKPYGFFDFIQSSVLQKERTEKFLQNIQFLLDAGITQLTKTMMGKLFWILSQKLK